MSMSTRGTVHYYDLLDIRQSSVAAAEHTDTGDNITVLFLCVALQYTLGENESIDAIQMPLLMPFSEYWTFSRPADAAIRAPTAPRMSDLRSSDRHRHRAHLPLLQYADAPAQAADRLDGRRHRPGRRERVVRLQAVDGW